MSVDNFRAAMRRAGLDYAGPIHADGNLQHFKVEGDHGLNSWYVLYSGPPAAGAFGCWKRDIKEKWCERNNDLSQMDWSKIQNKLHEASQAKAQKQKDQHEQARKKAEHVWEHAKPVTAHAYLTTKGVPVLGNLREDNGKLVLALRDADGRLHSLQFIDSDGFKKFLKGGRVVGCFFELAANADGPLVICEGYATGASIAEATGYATVCGMNAGNLIAVAKSLRTRFPERDIILAADNDQWTPKNPGRVKAEEAAKAIRARIALPQFENTIDKPTDFNDLHQEEGLTAVNIQINAATTPAHTDNEVSLQYTEQPLEYDRVQDNGVKGAQGAKPKVTLPSGSVSITQAATELYELIAPLHSMFIRGKAVVSLVSNMTGEQVLEPLTHSAARSAFEKYAALFAWRAGKDTKPVLKPMVMTADMAKAILACHVAVELLPKINGLVNCPVIVEKANRLQVCGKGYNADTGLLVLHGEKTPDVPFPEAARALEDLCKDFHFQSPSDWSRALAAFITPALKMGNLITGHVPIDIGEADGSQSGKTYRQKMVAAIYGEQVALVPLKRNGVGGSDESFFEKLVNGRLFIQFDNYRGRLDSPALEAFLTAQGSFPCRIPHCREIEVDPTRYFIMMTSNGVETTRDLANRASFVRIHKRPGAHYPDTLGDIKSQQPYYLGCVFSIIQEWHRQGKHRTKETRHDFRDWCQVLDWIVHHLLKHTPLMDGHQESQERVSNPNLTFIREMALEIERQNLLGQPLIATQIAELAATADITIPGLAKNESYNEDKAKKIVGIKLGAVFKNEEIIELDGFTITRNEEQRPRTTGDGGSYTSKTYTFSRSLP